MKLPLHAGCILVLSFSLFFFLFFSSPPSTHTKSMSEMSHRLKEPSLTYLQKKISTGYSLSGITEKSFRQMGRGGEKRESICLVTISQHAASDSNRTKLLTQTIKREFLFLKPRALVNIKLSLLGVQIKKAKLTVHRAMPKEDKGILQFGQN